MYLMCTLTHASNLIAVLLRKVSLTGRLQLGTFARESLSARINLFESQAYILNSSH